MCDKTGEHWDNFVEYAREHGIEFRHPEDYEPWWKCWYSDIKSVNVAEHKDEKVPVADVGVS